MPSILTSSFWDRLPMGIILFRDDQTVLYANQKANDWMSPAGSIGETVVQGTTGSDTSIHLETIKTILSGKEMQMVLPLHFITKTSNRFLRLTWMAIHQPDTSDIVGGAVIAEDISSETNLRNQAAQSQRLASIGKIAAKVTHELNNPLDGILRYINLSIRIIELGQIEKAKEYLIHSRSGLMRMIQIIGEMLDLSRDHKVTIEQSPLDRILQEAIRAMEAHTGKVRIELSCLVPQPLPLYRSDNLFQVFCNLIKNALDAMNDEGRLVITIQQVEQSLDIAFRDTGSGFPPEQAEAIFQPFFTTKGFGRGTGLGLAICRDIVGKLRGRITATNNPEGGSTFTVSLPVKEDIE